MLNAVFYEQNRFNSLFFIKSDSIKLYKQLMYVKFQGKEFPFVEN